MNTRVLPRCSSCPFNRRRFLVRGGLAAAGLAALTAGSTPLEAAARRERRARVRIVYALHAKQQPGPDWPNVGFDFGPAMAQLEAVLPREVPDVEWVSIQANGPEQAKAILEDDLRQQNVDGYLVCQMNCWNQVVQTFAASGKPVLYADFKYGGSGGFLVYNAAYLRRRAGNVGFVASSDMKDLCAAAECFTRVKRSGNAGDFARLTARARQRRTPSPSAMRPERDELRCLGVDDCLKRMRESRILAVRDQTAGDEGAVAGIPVQKIPFAELNEAWRTADRDESRAVADAWERGAARIDGVTRETLETSAAMYLAEKAVLKKHGANAITINCLGGFYGGHIHAYPCLGFHQLLNEGWVGGCECDVRSAATMVIGTLLTQGRPGYISDPVIDTSKRQIIYAHCVAANRAFGPAGEENPFEILTHSEDRQGASVRSLLPEGYMTTSLEFDQARKEVLMHRALAVGNDPDDRACRTKLCAEPVGDMEKLFTEWDRWSWHRVTFYGDLEAPVSALTEALGWKLVREA